LRYLADFKAAWSFGEGQGCTTNIHWKKWRPEKQAKTQNDEVFAEHRGTPQTWAAACGKEFRGQPLR